ncbi:hypothetical protein [Mesorhizobium sp. BHbdii]
MSRLVLYTGEHFGRFAVLLFGLPLFCPVLLWLLLVDRHPLAAIAAVLLPYLLQCWLSFC